MGQANSVSVFFYWSALVVDLLPIVRIEKSYNELSCFTKERKMSFEEGPLVSEWKR